MTMCKRTLNSDDMANVLEDIFTRALEKATSLSHECIPAFIRDAVCNGGAPLRELLDETLNIMPITSFHDDLLVSLAHSEIVDDIRTRARGMLTRRAYDLATGSDYDKARAREILSLCEGVSDEGLLEAVMARDGVGGPRDFDRATYLVAHMSEDARNFFFEVDEGKPSP